MALIDPLVNLFLGFVSQLTPIPLQNALSYVYTILFDLLLFLASAGGLGGN